MMGASTANHGYFAEASSEARVRFRPADPPSGVKTLDSSRVNNRSVWALPSNPPMAWDRELRTDSPLCPKGGWPRSWARHAVSTTSRSQPNVPASSRPIWATSRLWVRRVRTKSSVSGATTWVLAPSRRSAEECSTRALSRSKTVRKLVFGASCTQRC